MSCVFLKISTLNWYNLNTKVTFYFENFSHVAFLLELGGVSIRGAPWRAADASRIIEERERLF